MDRITEALLGEFARAHNIEGLAQDKQFEHLAAFITLRRHHNRTFDPSDIVVGEGGDTAIDSVAVIVNGVLVTDLDTVEELIERNGYIEANLVFVQAERSSGFDGAKMGSFGFGVEDFFKDKPTLVRNEKIADVAAIVKSLFDRGHLFRSKPTCRLYYVTTGTWQDDKNLVARRNGVIAALHGTSMFGPIEFQCLGADDIHRLYNQTKNAVTRAFAFKDRVEISNIVGVEQAYLGFVSAKEFLSIISDDSGDDILGSIFDENVRAGKITTRSTRKFARH